MRVRPLSPSLLVDELADRIAATQPGRRLRVAIDGPEAAEPDPFAASLVDPLRVRGRAALHIPCVGFLQPASLRFELGRKNPESFYERWLDEEGLRREVLDRLEPDGQVLPDLWDPVDDRASRSAYVTVPDGGVVLVSGQLLLGGVLPFDLTVHLSLSPGALARRTAPGRQWTLPAYERYEAEVRPGELADVVVRIDDPDRPAVVER